MHLSRQRGEQPLAAAAAIEGRNAITATRRLYARFKSFMPHTAKSPAGHRAGRRPFFAAPVFSLCPGRSAARSRVLRGRRDSGVGGSVSSLPNWQAVSDEFGAVRQRRAHRPYRACAVNVLPPWAARSEQI
jgi:hypothetical protein